MNFHNWFLRKGLTVESVDPFFISNICHFFDLLSHILDKIGFIPIICIIFYTYFNTFSGINFPSKYKHFKNNL